MGCSDYDVSGVSGVESVRALVDAAEKSPDAETGRAYLRKARMQLMMLRLETDAAEGLLGVAEREFRVFS